MTRIYAQHASTEFNSWMDDLNRRLSDDVRDLLLDNLVALILGGGYGRGEGGTVVVEGEERPFNDLDYTLIVAQKNKSILDQLKPISEQYAQETGIHVDFSRPLTLKDVRHLPHWLMWQDLVHGHIVLAGDTGVLEENAPESILTPLPVIEATRLLLNRGAGLLWGMRVVQKVEPEPDHGFIQRNYYKCIQGMGDALLIAHQRYVTPYQGRDRILEELEHDITEVRELGVLAGYRDALKFKFRPDEAPSVQETEDDLAALAAQWANVYRHVEEIRTGRSWADLQDYSNWSGVREPGEHTPKKLIRNIIQNYKQGTPSWRYARESLFCELPVLLGQAGPIHGDWREQSTQFLDRWGRFN